MTTNNQPIMGKNQLIKSVFIALLIGTVVLLTAVLPAEYNIDPIGAGKLFGFSKLHKDNVSTETEQANNQTVKIDVKKLKLKHVGSPADVIKPTEANNPAPTEQFPEQYDTVKVVVPANKGIEYKFKTLKYASVKYEWATDKDKTVFIDFHGEVKQENPPKNVFYESYTVAYSNNMAGTLTAPFEGKHGWYFRNYYNEDITVTIVLKGQYKLFNK
ncbi:MAG: hypothetical protein B6I20_13805 [Bacteroidetes bacterium 4572_117]|nr:MAG: hypothetical protein B6I20_13805 [Bacteroidetes bacterium 4572_117]